MMKKIYIYLFLGFFFFFAVQPIFKNKNKNYNNNNNNGDGDTNCSRSPWNDPEKRLRKLEIRGRIETILTTALSKSVRILRRVLEICGNIFCHTDFSVKKNNNNYNLREKVAIIIIIIIMRRHRPNSA